MSSPLFPALLTMTLTLLAFTLSTAYLRRRSRQRLTTWVRSGARLHLPDTPHGARFADVAGQAEAKQELAEITAFLKDPAPFHALGATLPRGVLLVGPPGCGKTLLARAVAGEAGCPFFATSGSEFMEVYAGIGATRVRDLFARARRLAPCIIFIDELDAIGRARGLGQGQGAGEREQTLNQLLVELDGFAERNAVVVIAATNRPEVLDPALLRPGRFDRVVTIDLPEREEREAILRSHAASRPLAQGASLALLAQATGGCSGAALAEIVNEAAILAVRHGLSAIDQPQLNAAAERVLLGAERRSLRPTETERRVLAYHEAGHTLASRTLTPDRAVQEASIVAHGKRLSVSLRASGADLPLNRRAELLAELAVTLAGRAAELLALGEASAYSADDVARATRLARALVQQHGMTEAFGPQALCDAHGHSTASAALTDRIDAEVARLVRSAQQQALDLLAAQRPALEALAAALLAEETLGFEQLEAILAA